MLIIGLAATVWLLIVVLVLAALRAAALADREEEERPPGPLHRGSQATAVLVAVSITPCVPDRAAAQSARTGCGGAGVAPDFVHERRALDATLCLMNEERARRDLRALHVDARLARAAQRHSADLVARSYFSHVSPGGGTLTERLRRVGYITRRCTWQVGETLAWGSGTAMTPASRVRAWMRSRSHRTVLTDPAYRDAGIGIVDGRPDGARDGATYSAGFGRRRFW